MQLRVGANWRQLLEDRGDCMPKKRKSARLVWLVRFLKDHSLTLVLSAILSA